jgi:histidinol-phosphate aminotransferase
MGRIEELFMSRDSSLLSRRSFLHASTLGSAAFALRNVTEPMLAFAAAPTHPPDAILINANENPLGPCAAARQAVAAVTPRSGRYLMQATDDLEKQFAHSISVRPEQVAIYAGSTEPLVFTVQAFCSPSASYVTADPGFEAGLFASERVKARVVKVPLTNTYAHDVKAMIAAGSDAGVFYVCNPNNPTGTLTSHSDIEYLLDHKPKNSIVMVDEAYIHFSDADTAIELVKAGKDVVVLRTFSKLYGMAGLRCGFAVARPDLLEKIHNYGGFNFMPVTAVAATSASLNDTNLAADRKRRNADVRAATFQWLDSNGYKYIPSQANFFLLDTKHSAKEAIEAMARQNVIIGRSWPALPNYSRVTIGTSDEMVVFQQAWQKVMKGSVSG